MPLQKQLQNLVFSQHICDRLALVIIYDLIGCIGCLTAIFGTLVRDEHYILNLVELSWARQVDQEHLKKKEREKQGNQKDKDLQKKEKTLAGSQSECKSKKKGYIYNKSGFAFTSNIEANDPVVTGRGSSSTFTSSQFWK